MCRPSFSTPEIEADSLSSRRSYSPSVFTKANVFCQGDAVNQSMFTRKASMQFNDLDIFEPTTGSWAACAEATSIGSSPVPLVALEICIAPKLIAQPLVVFRIKARSADAYLSVQLHDEMLHPLTCATDKSQRGRLQVLRCPRLLRLFWAHPCLSQVANCQCR